MFTALLTFSLLMFALTRAEAINLFTDISIGHDDNVAESASKTGSGFADLKAVLSHPFGNGGDAFRAVFSATGEYRDYFDAGDFHAVGAGASVERGFGSGRWRAALAADGHIFRDDESPDDDRDEVALTATLDWNAGPRMTLSGWQTFGWADYKEPVVTGGGGNGDMGMDESPDRPMEKTVQGRNDRFWNTRLLATAFLTPRITSAIGVEAGRRDSSADTESYDEIGLSAALVWNPLRQWEASVNAAWQRLDYDRAPRNLDRSDDTATIGLELRRSWDALVIYARMEYTTNDSPLPDEDYTKTVSQCGFTWSF